MISKVSVTHDTLEPMSHSVLANTTPNREGDSDRFPADWAGTLMERMHMEVVEHTAELTVIEMPVEGNGQTAGLLHGGASAALVETAASFAALLHARRRGDSYVAVGTELSISHLSAVSAGIVRARAQAVHLGRSSTVHVVEVHSDEGRLVASARVTNAILAKPGGDDARESGCIPTSA